MIRKFTLFSSVALLFIALAMPSCKKFEGGQEVPAYIRIDTLGLSCDYYTYGANTHNFIDAWVYVDDNIVGCFELPATIPVLKEGAHKVAVYPGIARDGIKDLRAPYPFIAPVEYNNLHLVKDSIITLFPIFNYYPNGDNLHVRWMEDFDSGSLSMEATSQSNAGIATVTGPLAWHDAGGVYSTRSGRVVLSSDTASFCIATKEELADLPKTGSACMLEMDYKCSDTCAVGLFYMENYTVTQQEIIRLRPTGTSGVEPERWNKIYINLGPYCVDHEDADYFKLYISSWYNRNDGPQYFYYDNLKIIYRDR